MSGTLDKATAVQQVLRQLQKMDVDETIELLTWKRDRSLVLIKQNGNEILVYERGFAEQEYQVTAEKLKKLLKTLLKREFPRSHKIRIQRSRAGL